MKEEKKDVPLNNKVRKKPNIKNMGVDIDKNEYYEIVTSNSARPEAGFGNYRRF